MPKVDIYLISEFKVRIRLDQIPVAKAVLVNTKQELNVILQVPVDIKVGYLDPARQLEPAGNRDSLFLICSTDTLSYLECNTKPGLLLTSAAGSYLFLSAGLTGTALCRGSNSSSCWMMDLALTCTPEILMLIPRRFPGPLAGTLTWVNF